MVADTTPAANRMVLSRGSGTSLADLREFLDWIDAHADSDADVSVSVEATDLPVEALIADEVPTEGTEEDTEADSVEDTQTDAGASVDTYDGEARPGESETTPADAVGNTYGQESDADPSPEPESEAADSDRVDRGGEGTDRFRVGDRVRNKGETGEVVKLVEKYGNVVVEFDSGKTRGVLAADTDLLDAVDSQDGDADTDDADGDSDTDDADGDDDEDADEEGEEDDADTDTDTDTDSQDTDTEDSQDADESASAPTLAADTTAYRIASTVSVLTRGEETTTTGEVADALSGTAWDELTRDKVSQNLAYLRKREIIEHVGRDGNSYLYTPTVLGEHAIMKAEEQASQTFEDIRAAWVEDHAASESETETESDPDGEAWDPESGEFPCPEEDCSRRFDQQGAIMNHRANKHPESFDATADDGQGRESVVSHVGGASPAPRPPEDPTGDLTPAVRPVDTDEEDGPRGLDALLSDGGSSEVPADADGEDFSPMFEDCDASIDRAKDGSTE